MSNPLHAWLSSERGRAKMLADHLKVPASLVSKMARGEKQIPLDHCPAIEAFTGGTVLCEELRPDKADYFAYLRARPGPQAISSTEELARA